MGYNPEPKSYSSTAPSALSLASVSNTNSREKSGNANTGALHKAYFNAVKAISQESSHDQSFPY